MLEKPVLLPMLYCSVYMVLERGLCCKIVSVQDELCKEAFYIGKCLLEEN